MQEEFGEKFFFDSAKNVGAEQVFIDLKTIADAYTMSSRVSESAANKCI